MANHRAVQVESAGQPLTLVDVETTSPPPGHVRIAVAACGVCGTDHAFVTGGFPGLAWPVTPGHEIAGTVAELGDGVEGFAVGDRVAVGWFGGNCNRCVPCRKGQFMQCVNLQVPSWHYPGGYAESVTAPATALARIPAELSFVEAAPMGCAGVTTFNAPAPHPGRRRRPGGRARRRRPRPSRRAVGGGDGFRDRRDRPWGRQGRRRADAGRASLHRLDGRRRRRRTAEAGRCRRRAGDGGQLRGDGPDRRRAGPARRTGDRRRHARAAADQPAGPDQRGAVGDRPSVGHRRATSRRRCTSRCSPGCAP